MGWREPARHPSCKKICYLPDGAQLGYLLGIDFRQGGVAIPQGGEDFDLFDGVDAKFAFKVHIVFEHICRIARFLSDQGPDDV